MMRPLEGEAGVIMSDQVASVVRTGTEHNPHTAVVAMENTHNAAGGRIFPIDEARAVSKVARDRGVSLHMDGARLFNAQAATGTAASEWASCVDTLTFCFSKGLGAPVGSMVVGPSDVLSESHRLRKRLGGGMRQAGVIAAAARVALETGPERLHEDHSNARRLAEALAAMNPSAVDLGAVDTNMVYVDVGVFGTTGAQVSAALRREGILTLGSEGPVMRLVTHRDVSSDEIETAVSALQKVLV
jgi:threonine aldolase